MRGGGSVLNVAVVDDEEKERERLNQLLTRYAEAKDETFHIVGFQDGVQFITKYQTDAFDMVFMDVDMPGMDGFATAQKLRKLDSSVVLIFVTNLARYAIKGYEVEALDYLLKPLTYEAFALKIAKAVSICKRNNRNRITIKTRSSQAVFPASAIIYIESDGHRILYHTENGDFSAYGTMKDVGAQLPPDSFFRVNSGCIVNLSYVSGYDGAMLFLSGRGKVEISRARKKDFLEALANYRLAIGG